MPSVVNPVVAQVAVTVAPLPLKGASLHSVVAPLLNVTEPVGVADVLVLVTLAVKVTPAPVETGFSVEPVMVVVVEALLVVL
jgi:hypothetical protein